MTGAKARQILLAASLGTTLVALLFGASVAAAAPPNATIESATAGYQAARVSGEIDPGNQEVSFYAESRLKGSSDAWSEELIETIAANSGPTPVTGLIKRLTAGSEYEFRIDAYVPGEGETVSAEPNPTATPKAIAAPTVSLDPVTTFTARTAHFVGHINPEAPEAAPASPEVERAFAVPYHFECTPACLDPDGGFPVGLGGEVPAGNSSQPVVANVENLLPGTTYTITLEASNAGEGENFRIAGPVTFTTLPEAPSIKDDHASRVAYSSASVMAEITPNGSQTSFHVEYGPTTDYGQSTPEFEVGADTTEHEISATLESLVPGTTYHWRIVASNEVGSTAGPDHAFVTFAESGAAGSLPDGRAYEQVSSTDKAGANAQGSAFNVQASPDGSAIVYGTAAVLPESEGAQDFGTYNSKRAGPNWVTEGLLPSAKVGLEGRVVSWSDDLKYSYVTSARFTGTEEFFYSRDNATHQLTQIYESNFAPTPQVLGSSINDEMMYFEVERKLVHGAAEGHNVYLWNRRTGDLSLASVLNSGKAPIGGAFNGPYDYPEGNLNAGGFYFLREGAISPDGNSLYFTAAGTGDLYLRKHVSAVQSPVDAKGNCTVAQDACTVLVSRSRATTPDPKRPKPAAFIAASTTGSPMVLFASAAKLTDDATTGPDDEGFDLYRYDVSTGHLTDLVPDKSDPAGAQFRGLLGMSTDGSRVYFVANGVLGDGASKGASAGNCRLNEFFAYNPGACNLYLWEAGNGVRYLARLSQGVSEPDAVDWAPSRGEFGSRTARVSHSGSTLAFRSNRRLTDYDNEGKAEYYRYEVGDAQLVCMTCDPSGAGPLGAPTLTSIGQSANSGASKVFLTRNLSADGSRFFFETPDQLVPADTNGENGCGGASRICQDVYEWEAQGSGSCTSTAQDGGCLFLISTGKSSDPSFFADADEEGNNVMFYTQQSLVTQDKDDLQDIYDASVGGGLPAQNQPEATPCDSRSACQSAASPPPETVTPGTSTFQGPAPAPTPGISCKKGYKKIRKHGQVVCKKKKHGKHRGPHRGKAHAKTGGSK